MVGKCMATTITAGDAVNYKANTATTLVMLVLVVLMVRPPLSLGSPLVPVAVLVVTVAGRRVLMLLLRLPLQFRRQPTLLLERQML